MALIPMAPKALEEQACQWTSPHSYWFWPSGEEAKMGYFHASEPENRHLYVGSRVQEICLGCASSSAEIPYVSDTSGKGTPRDSSPVLVWGWKC